MSHVTISACKCDRCGHVWIGDNPKRCAKCKSTAWDASTKHPLAMSPKAFADLDRLKHYASCRCHMCQPPQQANG